MKTSLHPTVLPLAISSPLPRSQQTRWMPKGFCSTFLTCSRPYNAAFILPVSKNWRASVTLISDWGFLGYNTTNQPTDMVKCLLKILLVCSYPVWSKELPSLLTFSPGMRAAISLSLLGRAYPFLEFNSLCFFSSLLLKCTELLSFIQLESSATFYHKTESRNPCI